MLIRGFWASLKNANRFLINSLAIYLRYFSPRQSISKSYTLSRLMLGFYLFKIIFHARDDYIHVSCEAFFTCFSVAPVVQTLDSATHRINSLISGPSHPSFPFSFLTWMRSTTIQLLRQHYANLARRKLKFEGQLKFLFSSVVSLSWTLWRCKHSKLSTDILGW